MDRDRAPDLHGWIAGLLAVGVFVAQWSLPRGTRAGLRWAGVATLALAAILMFLPFILLPRYGGTAKGRPYYETTRIADRGLYGVVRHPQYLGYMLLVLGFAALSQHPVTVGLAVLSAGFFAAWTVGEERRLRRRFGTAWEEYASRVPRLNLPAGIVRRLRKS